MASRIGQELDLLQGSLRDWLGGGSGAEWPPGLAGSIGSGLTHSALVKYSKLGERKKSEKLYCI